jgi:hypothetical protein
MRFPGGRLLHTWELTTQRVSLEDLLGSCAQVGLSGFAELHLGTGVGTIFYYMGTEVSVVYRDGPVGYQGAEALEHLRHSVETPRGSIRVYEVPLEMAHLLRGVSNRRRLNVPLASPTDLESLLERFKTEGRTGLVEIQAGSGAAALLLVNGRMSNMYWQATDGPTLEQGAALVGLQQALHGQDVSMFVSDFSRDVWRNRHEATHAVSSRLDVSGTAPGSTDLAGSETLLRRQLLADLDEQVPSMIQAFVVDLMTGAVLSRRIRGTSALRVAILSDKVPALLVLSLREIAAAEGADALETLQFQTGHALAVVEVAAEVQEALVVIADKAQPGPHIAGVLNRACRAYTDARRRLQRPRLSAVGAPASAS